MKVGTFEIRGSGRDRGIGGGCAEAQPAWAQSPNYSPDFSTNQHVHDVESKPTDMPAVCTVGSDNVLRLTPSATNQTGSAWFNVQQPVKNGFTTTFTFQIHTGRSTYSWRTG